MRRIAEVVDKAVDTFGTLVKAASWLNTPNRAPEGVIPLNLMDTDEGAHQVMTILGRIDYGLYS